MLLRLRKVCIIFPWGLFHGSGTGIWVLEGLRALGVYDVIFFFGGGVWGFGVLSQAEVT